jgi:hypothetical protein
MLAGRNYGGLNLTPVFQALVSHNVFLSGFGAEEISWVYSPPSVLESFSPSALDAIRRCPPRLTLLSGKCASFVSANSQVLNTK